MTDTKVRDSASAEAIDGTHDLGPMNMAALAIFGVGSLIALPFLVWFLEGRV